jgi:hypothetical protein
LIPKHPRRRGDIGQPVGPVIGVSLRQRRRGGLFQTQLLVAYSKFTRSE